MASRKRNRADATLNTVQPRTATLSGMGSGESGPALADFAIWLSTIPPEANITTSDRKEKKDTVNQVQSSAYLPSLVR